VLSVLVCRLIRFLLLFQAMAATTFNNSVATKVLQVDRSSRPIIACSYPIAAATTHLQRSACHSKSSTAVHLYLGRTTTGQFHKRAVRQDNFSAVGRFSLIFADRWDIDRRVT
jgi:hypothetical protein